MGVGGFLEIGQVYCHILLGLVIVYRYGVHQMKLIMENLFLLLVLPICSRSALVTFLGPYFLLSSYSSMLSIPRDRLISRME